jgi:hypothetical protein
MLFFDAEVGDSSSSKFKSFGGDEGFLKGMETAFSDYVANVTEGLAGLTDIVQNQQKQMVGIDTAAKNILRSMGGIADFTGKGSDRAGEFRRTLNDALSLSLKFGGSMKDVQEAAAGLAEGMGRMVNPSAVFLKDIIATGKAFGLTNKEVTKMVTDLVRMGGTQEEALQTMRGIADEARRAGVNTAAYMKAVQGGLKMAGGFGFKNGIEGLKTMAKQAAMLRTSIESIGAKGLQQKILDPEGAIEAAAGFQMLGGAIGKLGDPFQLLYMAQSDMAGLQDELAKSTASAFKFNKATGTFDASTQDLYRLRQQAELTGANLDDMLESGREMAKLDFISKSVDLSNLDEAQQGVLSSLAQIDKDGKVRVDIPGFDEGTKDLTDLMKDQNFKDALDKYEIDSKKTAEEIAISQMNLEEKQLSSLQQIEKGIVLSLSDKEQEKLIKDIEQTNKITADAYKKLTSDVSTLSQKELTKGTELEKGVATAGATALETGTTGLKRSLENISTINDAFFPNSGTAPMILSKGKLYQGIVGDEVAVGTNLGSALSNVGGNVGGSIDININLNGSISGDNNLITNMFKKPEVQKEIMDTVLYKLNQYKRQQGVIS